MVGSAFQWRPGRLALEKRRRSRSRRSSSSDGTRGNCESKSCDTHVVGWKRPPKATKNHQFSSSSCRTWKSGCPEHPHPYFLGTNNSTFRHGTATSPCQCHGCGSTAASSPSEYSVSSPPPRRPTRDESRCLREEARRCCAGATSVDRRGDHRQWRAVWGRRGLLG